ncbi:MAG: phospho-N-acetylmuramoyl-pentapeptide-transferase [Pseudomonadota bacterium]
MLTTMLHTLSHHTCLALLTGFVATALLMPPWIRFLKAAQMGQPIRSLGVAGHEKKRGTPTMGGLALLLGMLVGVSVTQGWGIISGALVVLVVLHAIIGGLDDWAKIKKNHTTGLRAWTKFIIQVCLATAVYWLLSTRMPVHTLYVPFMHVDLVVPSAVYWLWIIGVLTGTVNAVNLTDGMDGLAIVPVCGILIAFGLMAGILPPEQTYLTAAELVQVQLLCFAGAGAGLGFLWFNCHPASLFMGDVGALGLGALLGGIALLLRREGLLFIMAGLMVLETVSVILQVGSFKTRGKRIFKMAPLHHHFELSGWSEPQICVRFWLVTALLIAAAWSDFL